VQRVDDDEAVVRKRLRIFEDQTRPLVDHYRRRPGFFSVDGDQPPDRVAAGLEAAVKSFTAVPAPVREGSRTS
jgi:adenylate kinase